MSIPWHQSTTDEPDCLARFQFPCTPEPSARSALAAVAGHRRQCGGNGIVRPVQARHRSLGASMADVRGLHRHLDQPLASCPGSVTSSVCAGTGALRMGVGQTHCGLLCGFHSGGIGASDIPVLHRPVQGSGDFGSHIIATGSNRRAHPSTRESGRRRGGTGVFSIRSREDGGHTRRWQHRGPVRRSAIGAVFDAIHPGDRGEMGLPRCAPQGDAAVLPASCSINLPARPTTKASPH